jgi:hypothetical protein
MQKPTNFLDAKQVQDLTFRGWQIKASGFYIDLYRDDFVSESDFEDVCSIAGVDQEDTYSITLLCFGVQSDNK